MRMILEDKRALVTGASVGIGRAVARAGAWSFEVTHHEVREDEVVVLGKLPAEGIAKVQFGVSQVTREKGSGALVSLGDDLKAAATDSRATSGPICTTASTGLSSACRR